MSDQQLAETRRRNMEESERAYRWAMLRSSHKRWQRAREWNGTWENPVPHGAPVSIWRKLGDCWYYHRHADRVDWTQVRAYRLEHGTPYPDSVPAPKRVPAELAGVLPPVLQFRLDRIDAALARIEERIENRNFWDEFKPMLARLASVGRNAEHQDALKGPEA